MPNIPAPPPAPLDPVDLDAVLAPFGHSRMLPAAAYVSNEVLAWERRWFFDGGWVSIGRGADLPRAGDQRGCRLGEQGEQSVLAVRDPAGGLRAFANVCRHRGHELLPCGEPTINRGVVQCPYHAWTYELDGRLRLAPRFEDVPNFDRAELGLTPVPAGEWGGWAFVNADGLAPPLVDVVGNLDRLVAPWPLDRLVPAATHRYEVRANWKLIQENYHECYHCPLIHPQLCVVSPPDSGDNCSPRGSWVGGAMDLGAGAETMSMSGRSDAGPLPGLAEEWRRRVLYVGLFPNLLVSLHPDYVLTHRLEPVAPDRTVVECTWLFAPDAIARPGFDPAYAVDFWDLTNRQDWAAVESVQRNLRSPHFRPGPLAPKEDAVYQLVTMVARGYRHEPLRPVVPDRQV